MAIKALRVIKDRRERQGRSGRRDPQAKRDHRENEVLPEKKGLSATRVL